MEALLWIFISHIEYPLVRLDYADVGTWILLRCELVWRLVKEIGSGGRAECKFKEENIVKISSFLNDKLAQVDALFASTLLKSRSILWAYQIILERAMW